jgi:hypothetical protein
MTILRRAIVLALVCAGPLRQADAQSDLRVDAFQQDQQGRLWALSQGVGAYRLTPGPPRLVFASGLATSVFLVSRNSGLVGMLEDGDSIWLGSINGLLRMRNGKWTGWTREHGLPGDSRIRAQIADRSGNYWMMTGGGLLRVSRAQLEATPDGLARPLSFARIGQLDGIVPHPNSQSTSPAATAGRSGRLYFTTFDAIAVVDPVAVGASSPIPPIATRAISEGRDTVQALRESAETSDDLPRALSVLADQLIADNGGAGVDATVLEGGVSGHWGMPGMRERAELIGGTLHVRSRVGAGTEVELTLPAVKAYAATQGRRRFWSRRHEADTRR